MTLKKELIELTKVAVFALALFAVFEITAQAIEHAQSTYSTKEISQ